MLYVFKSFLPYHVEENEGWGSHNIRRWNLKYLVFVKDFIREIGKPT